MSGKCVNKFMMVVMINLIILTAFAVEANDPTPAASKPDTDQDTLEICLKKELEKCKEEHEHESMQWAGCIVYEFFGCVGKHRLWAHRQRANSAFHTTAKNCTEDCFPVSKVNHLIRGAKCLLECYAKKIKKKDTK